MIIDAKESASIDKNIEPQAKTSLNRTDIKNWARDNYNQDDPVSSSSSVPYYDFSEIDGAYDCTNFVSHALLAGRVIAYEKVLKTPLL